MEKQKTKSWHGYSSKIIRNRAATPSKLTHWFFYYMILHSNFLSLGHNSFSCFLIFFSHFSMFDLTMNGAWRCLANQYNGHPKLMLKFIGRMVDSCSFLAFGKTFALQKYIKPSVPKSGTYLESIFPMISLCEVVVSVI